MEKRILTNIFSYFVYKVVLFTLTETIGNDFKHSFRFLVSMDTVEVQLKFRYSIIYTKKTHTSILL